MTRNPSRAVRLRRRLRAALIDVVAGIPFEWFAVGGVGVDRARRLESIARDETASRAALLAALVDAVGVYSSTDLVMLTGMTLERAREIVAVVNGDDFGASEAPERWEVVNAIDGGET